MSPIAIRLLREWTHRVVGMLLRPNDADLEEELRLHLALADEDARRRGEPVRAARLHTGSVTPTRLAFGSPWAPAAQM